MHPAISATGVVARLAISFVIISAVLFGSAGTLNWPEAWLYIILQFSFSAAIAAWLKKNNPDLLKERMTFLKQSAQGWDKAITLGFIPAFAACFLLAGLDAVRYGWSAVSWPVKAAGFVGILASLAVVFWVMHENTYLSRVVEIQKERGHQVISTGPYRYVRHPMYAGTILLFFSIPLALGSLWALIPAAVLTAVLVVRIHLEERMLREGLEGYTAYAEKVRYRLIPGIW
jgi:protein-S-isoprenylcysteine O-methyltransferase Ste14